VVHLFSRLRVFALLILVSSLALFVYPLAAQDTPTEEPADYATPSPIEAEHGPGSFNLLTPTEGLADLSSYRATLTLSFEGTFEDQPQQWSKTYVMIANQTPAARQITIDTAGNAAPQVFMAEVNGTVYERRAGTPCTASAAEAEGAFAERWELAGFLASILGADEAGTETVNGVETNHYTFDEQAHGASGVAESTGEMWVAADGGYLVRYRLVTEGSKEYFGEETEGTVTWEYELSDVNQPLTVDVPADCPAGMVDLTVLPDATDVVRVPGLTSFNTVTSIANAAAFYDDQLSSLGGEATTPLSISDSSALLEYTQGDEVTSVFVMAGEGNNLVYITIGSTEPPAESPANTVVEPVATQAGAESSEAPAACAISAGGTVNQRSGPGTTYERAGTLAGGTSAPVIGQATGADGFVWWQLGEGVWVRSDVVNQTGTCDSVPVVAP
jgi:hypothetical protein